MILLLDNLINNYLNILSCFIIVSIFNLNKYNFFMIIIIDIFLNQIPFVSFIILLLILLNKIILKRIVNNDINKFILLCIYMLLFISFIYLFNDYNYSYTYFLKNNIFSIILNIFVYYIYIFYNQKLLKFTIL